MVALIPVSLRSLHAHTIPLASKSLSDHVDNVNFLSDVDGSNMEVVMNVALEFSPSEGAGETDAARLLRVQRQAFLADMNPSRSIRLDRLNRLERMLERDEALFCNAITQDYGSRARIV